MRQSKPRAGAALLLALAALGLGGCVTRPQPLYYWGDYPVQQYSYLKGESGPEDGIQRLEKIREEARAKGLKLPPGLQAHLALLYGQTGRTDQFEQNLQAERASFPESSAYLDFLLKKKQNAEAAR